MNYTLEKYDFRNYLLETLKDTRQEELIFWKKTIPMPIDLIYTMFEKRGILLKKYIDHIGAACLFAFSMKLEGKDWKAELAEQPTKNNIPQAAQLTALFKKYMAKSGVMNMLKQLADTLLLNDYTTDRVTLTESLCHDGRKYKRLYLPLQLRPFIQGYFPDVLPCVALSNNDMFSNVVADELHIYRMGFADAFSGIFNKLIDFILDHADGKRNYSSASTYVVVDENTGLTGEPPVAFGRVSDGSMWEPAYSASRTGYVINSHHPFAEWARNKGPEAEEILSRMVAGMAKLENESIKESERNILERFRQDLSRNLRLETEVAHSPGVYNTETP